MLARGDSPAVGMPPGRNPAPAVGVEAAPPPQGDPSWVGAAIEWPNSLEGAASKLETASPHKDASLQKASTTAPASRAYPATFDIAEFGGGLSPILG